MVSEDWTRLRGELDLLCTAYIHRGGWGNGWNEPPGDILFAIARAAHGREMEEFDAYGEHVGEVLIRAGISPGMAQLAHERVSNTMATVSAFLEYTADPRRHDRLDRQRSRPLAPACDPRTDPRWRSPVTTRLFDGGGVIAHVCATDEEWIHKFGDLDRWPAHPAMLWCHRTDGPALVLYYQGSKQVFEEYWYQYGRSHRSDGPQRVMYDRDGSLIEERWMEDDVLIRAVRHKDA